MHHLITQEDQLGIIDIQDYPGNERCTVGGESIESAKGCHVNFLKVNNAVILPKLKLSRRTSGDYNRFNNKILQEMGYDVKPIDCTKLSELGGVIHCISWEWCVDPGFDPQAVTCNEDSLKIGVFFIPRS